MARADDVKLGGGPRRGRELCDAVLGTSEGDVCGYVTIRASAAVEEEPCETVSTGVVNDSSFNERSHLTTVHVNLQFCYQCSFKLVHHVASRFQFRPVNGSVESEMPRKPDFSSIFSLQLTVDVTDTTVVQAYSPQMDYRHDRRVHDRCVYSTD